MLPGACTPAARFQQAWTVTAACSQLALKRVLFMVPPAASMLFFCVVLPAAHSVSAVVACGGHSVVGGQAGCTEFLWSFTRGGRVFSACFACSTQPRASPAAGAALPCAAGATLPRSAGRPGAGEFVTVLVGLRLRRVAWFCQRHKGCPRASPTASAVLPCATGAMLPCVAGWPMQVSCHSFCGALGARLWSFRLRRGIKLLYTLGPVA